jgi:hypothetical protein
VSSPEGALRALLAALETGRPLFWTGNVLVTLDQRFDLDGRIDLGASQATMVLDAEDMAELRKLAPGDEKVKLFDIPAVPPRCECGWLKRFESEPGAKHRFDCPHGIWLVANDANVAAAEARPDLYTAAPAFTVEKYGAVHTWSREPVRGWIARLRRRLALDVDECTCTFEMAGHAPDCPLYVRD